MKLLVGLLSIAFLITSCVEAEKTIREEMLELKTNPESRGLGFNGQNQDCGIEDPLVFLEPNPLVVDNTETITFKVKLKNMNGEKCPAIPYFKHNFVSMSLSYTVNSVVQLYQHTPVAFNETVELYEVVATPNSGQAPEGQHRVNVELGEGLYGNYYRQAVYFTAESSTPTCVRSAPSISVNPGTFNGLVGDSFTYSMTLQDNNQNCGDSLYALSYQVLPQGFSSNITNHTLASGQSITVTRTINTTGAAMGNHEFLLRAQDANAENFSASDAEFLVVLTEPDPIEEPAAPVLNSATYSSGNYVLTFSQPDGSLAPAGGYDTFINNVDLNDRDQYSGFSRTITGLDNQVEQCFKIQGRYTQLSPAEFPVSNEICVAAQAPTCVRANPSLAVSPSSFSGNAGDSFNFNVTLTNNDQNCANNTFALGYQNLPSGFSSNLPSTRTLAAGASTTFAVSMSVAESVAASNYSTVLSAANGQYSGTKSLSFNIQEENNQEETLAFPGAVGFGKNATGGRGGQVIKVTNLNNSGSGSLRSALLASGPRTVVFEVGGTINLSSQIYIENPHLTIAGETAPGGGILIKGGNIHINASNVIMRHLRIRRGDNNPSTGGQDALRVVAWSGETVENVMIDHVSLSWAMDENLDLMTVGSGVVKNITISNSIIAENTYGVLTSAGVKDTTFYRNYLAHNSERNIRIGGYTDIVEQQQLRAEMINNIIYGHRSGTTITFGQSASVINNKFKKAPSTSFPWGAEPVGGTSSGQNSPQNTHVHVSGNIVPIDGVSQTDSNLAPYLFDEPLNSSNIADIASANALEGLLLDNVGASKPSRDAVDARLINQYNTNTGSIVTGVHSSGYPTIESGSAPADSDNDGMPDAWEIARGLNPNQADNNGDDDGDGYTNLEEYLHSKANGDSGQNQGEVLKAFPTAVGGGSNATGGRGGQIVRVTNLNNSGPGSLRDALLKTFPRIIIFDVSGRIHLTSKIELNAAHSNFTIAGQSAPEGGITISGNRLHISGGWNLPQTPTDNFIIRYIRFRNGNYTGVPDVADHNAIILRGGENHIFDHCSFSFNDDQALAIGSSVNPLRGFTLQRSLFSENATGIIAGFHLDTPTGDLSFMYNLFADQSHRTPNMGGSGKPRFDVINNVLFNWKSRLSNVNRGNPQVNYIGNYLKPGSYTTPNIANKVQSGIYADTSIYSGNNYHPSLYPSPQSSDFNLWTDFFSTNPVPNSYLRSTEFPLLENTPEVMSAQAAYTNVLADVGANKFLGNDGSVGLYMDSYDTQKIANVQNGVSSDPSNKNWTQPTLPNNTRPANYDTDNDGMADAWEIATFGNLSETHNGDNDGDGYTNIEEYLNQVDI